MVIFPVATVVSNCCYENKEQRQWTFIIIWTWIIMKRAFFQRQSIRLSLAYVMCIFVNFNVLHCTPMFSKWALQLTQPAPSEHLCLHWEWKKILNSAIVQIGSKWSMCRKSRHIVSAIVIGRYFLIIIMQVINKQVVRHWALLHSDDTAALLIIRV